MGYPEKLYDTLKTAVEIGQLKGTEEHLHLEVKTGGSPLSEDDKGYLSQALSGFGNSDGGILIYGLKTERQSSGDPDVITAMKPIKTPEKVVTEINALTGQIVVPIVDGVRVKAIPTSKRRDFGYVVVLIPVSDSAPHRAMSKKIGGREYWKRAGDSFYRMEHYDLADMFGRRQRPKLEVFWRMRPGHEGGASGSPRLGGQIIIGIRNEGRSIARFPFLAVSLTGARWHDCGLDGNRRIGLPMATTSRHTAETVYRGGSDYVIHPGDEFEVNALEDITVDDKDPKVPGGIHLRFRVASENFPLKVGEIRISGSEVLAEIQKIWRER